MSETKIKQEPINLFDFEALAGQKVSRLAWDYYCSGACDEITLAENMAAFKRIFLRPRMLRDVSNRKMSVTLFGKESSMPIMIAPTAFHKLAHPDGELATARAAVRAGTIMILSTLATSTIEDVAAAGKDNIWFQLYVYKDRAVTKGLVERAEAAGCLALVVTVDSPLLGRREKDVRNHFQLPRGLSVANLANANLQDFPDSEGQSGLAKYIADLYDTALTWDDLAWFKSITELPVIIKGILRADDAELAVEYGCSAIIVSNHGGRQLDTTIATITALPEVVRAVAGRVPVFMDGGIRRGTDVLKAIAYGASAVFIGRPILWGLAMDGEDGVAAVLEMIRSEFDLSMALSGCQSLSDITEDLLKRSD